MQTSLTIPEVATTENWTLAFKYLSYGARIMGFRGHPAQ